MGDEVGAGSEHDGVGHGGEELDEREVDGDQALSRDPGVEVVLAEGVEAGRGLGFVDEGLRDTHPGDSLLEGGVDDRDAFPGGVVQAGGASTERDSCDGERKHHGQGEQSELGVDQDEGDADADERDH